MDISINNQHQYEKDAKFIARVEIIFKIEKYENLDLLNKMVIESEQMEILFKMIYE